MSPLTSKSYGDSQPVAWSGEMQPFKDHPSNHGHFTGLRNKPGKSRLIEIWSHIIHINQCCNVLNERTKFKVSVMNSFVTYCIAQFWQFDWWSKTWWDKFPLAIMVWVFYSLIMLLLCTHAIYISNYFFAMTSKSLEMVTHSFAYNTVVAFYGIYKTIHQL